jgi:hypothetical protein
VFGVLILALSSVAVAALLRPAGDSPAPRQSAEDPARETTTAEPLQREASSEPDSLQAAPRPRRATPQRSVLAGTWAGEGTQYAPRGTTQRVSLATTIDASGRTGTHSEFIVGDRSTSDCRGVLRFVSFGRYAYSERSDAGCIATTSIQLTRRGRDALAFTETYSTDDGERGRVTGTLQRTDVERAPTSTTADDWPSATGAWTVVLAATRQRSNAVIFANRARAAGYDARVLRSDSHGTLTPGYWIAYSGVLSESEARDRQAEIRADGFADAYARFVSAR